MKRFVPAVGENKIRIIRPIHKIFDTLDNTYKEFYCGENCIFCETEKKYGGIKMDEERMKHSTACYGFQSKEEIISAWPFSSSSGTTVYEVQLHSDGVLTCNCPGWVNHPSRACKHVKEKLEEAELIFTSKKPPVFEKFKPSFKESKEKRLGRLIRME